MGKRYQLTPMAFEIIEGVKSGEGPFFKGSVDDYYVLIAVDMDSAEMLDSKIRDRLDFKQGFRRLFEAGYIEPV